MEKAALAVFIAQLVNQLRGITTFGRAQGIGVPFGRIAVSGGDKGGFTAHGEAHIVRHQLLVDPFTQGQNRIPLVVGVRPCDTRRLVDARHRHAVRERHFCFVNQAFDGRRTRRLGRAGQRHMAFTSQQPGGGVQANPSRAWQVDLAPGMQVGEVDLGATGAVERFHIGLELDQIAGDEAGCQANMAQQIHQQPAGVPARARAQGEGFFWRLHAWFHANQVTNVLLKFLVQPHQKIDGAGGLLGRSKRGDIVFELGRQRRFGQVGRQFLCHQRFVLERKMFCAWLKKEIEGVEHRHFNHDIDRDLEFRRGLWKHQACLVVGEGILLPVDEVLFGLDPQRIREDATAAVGGGAQADDLGPQLDRSVVVVFGDVVKRGMDRHESTLARAKPVPTRSQVLNG